MMTSSEIRKKFLEFFASKQHTIVPSAPIVVKDDPTLMFTNAGMNQFKDLFLGTSEVKHPRVADTQKCLRVSGKHNDLEEVGHDTYHHTMFEMLGNWSFGDYFKEDAINWAWELLTGVYGMDPSRLYVTVFEGDATEGLSPDEEARALWGKYMPADRILNGSKKDNFWEMGDQGPCGPCTEIHVDVRSEAERSLVDGKALVNAGHPQVVEIWNVVFMEFNRLANGSLQPLPARHVDTGMGFERLCMVLQGKQSNYDTDVFQPLLLAIGKLTGTAYGQSEKTDIAMRVVADHVRAVAFSIADGQMPSSSGAGYVIRRLLRRAVRYAVNFLNKQEPFIHELVDVLAAEMGPFFPEITAQKDFVKTVIREEEASFLRTLSHGLELLEGHMAQLKGTVLPGQIGFELYDTYGFPVDLTELLLRERGLELDRAGFEAAMEAQRNRSRSAAEVKAGDWVILQESDYQEFVGYDLTEVEVVISRYRTVETAQGELVQLVFNQTPFYAEGGGQVGDTGTLSHKGDTLYITDTRREMGQIVHYAHALPENPFGIFKARVDVERRHRTAGNHSATHLLHQALREVLGTHVEQKGSLVHPDYLRFDFSHFSRLTEAELDEVELKVNQKILANLTLVEHRSMAREQALAMGAMALFGEKYGDTVRAIQFGTSIELCGGTHVPATGRIGLFLLVGESAVAAGIRRVEALTGEAAHRYMKERLQTLGKIGSLLKNPTQPMMAVEGLKSDLSHAHKTIEDLQHQLAVYEKQGMLAAARQVQGIQVMIGTTALDAAALKDVAFQIKDQYPNAFFLMGSVKDGKPMLTLALGKDLVEGKKWNAGQLIKEWAKHIRGGGGGQPFFATAGGQDPAGLDNALNMARQFVES